VEKKPTAEAAKAIEAKNNIKVYFILKSQYEAKTRRAYLKACNFIE
jgi:hypothetical protein